MKCNCHSYEKVEVIKTEDRQDEIICRLTQRDVINVYSLEEYKASVEIRGKKFKIVVLAKNDNKAKEMLLEFLRDSFNNSNLI